METLTAAVFVFLYFQNAHSNEGHPISFEERIGALESQANIPFINRRAISGLEKKILKKMSSMISTGKDRVSPDSLSGLVERIDTMEKTLIRICDQVDALVKGLSDEKGIRRDDSNDIRRDTSTLKQTVEEQQKQFESQMQRVLERDGKTFLEEFQNSIRDQLDQFEEQIQSELREERTTFLESRTSFHNSIKYQQGLFEREIRSEFQRERKSLQTYITEKQDEFEDQAQQKIREESREIQTLVKDQLDLFENRLLSNISEESQALKDFIVGEQKRFEDQIKVEILAISNHFNKQNDTRMQTNTRCPSNWIKHGSMCYLFVNNERRNWYMALKKCREYGGTLAEVHDSDTLEFMNRHRRNLRPWIGGTDRETEGVWKWVGSDDEIEYLNWEGGGPYSLYGDDEDCIMIQDGKYGDNLCVLRSSFICQKKI